MQAGRPKTKEFLKFESMQTQISDNNTSRLTPSTSSASYNGMLQKDGSAIRKTRDISSW
jgi:hypothetical protein